MNEKIISAVGTDASFAECHVILCRNVLVYFDKDLQARVHGLLHESLVTFVILCLDNKESPRVSPYEQQFEQLDARERIYPKAA